MKATPIPDDEARWTRSFSVIHEDNRKALRAILERDAAGRHQGRRLRPAARRLLGVVHGRGRRSRSAAPKDLEARAQDASTPSATPRPCRPSSRTCTTMGVGAAFELRQRGGREGRGAHDRRPRPGRPRACPTATTTSRTTSAPRTSAPRTRSTSRATFALLGEKADAGRGRREDGAQARERARRRVDDQRRAARSAEDLPPPDARRARRSSRPTLPWDGYLGADRLPEHRARSTSRSPTS